MTVDDGVVPWTMITTTSVNGHSGSSVVAVDRASAACIDGKRYLMQRHADVDITPAAAADRDNNADAGDDVHNDCKTTGSAAGDNLSSCT